MNTTKDILDKFVVKVIKSNAIFTIDEGEKWGVDQHKAIDYTPETYSKDMVLMFTPFNWLRLEFEDTPDHNRLIINLLEAEAKSLGYDYCVTEHKGAKSPYFNMCNLPHPGDADDWKILKDLLIHELIPDKHQTKLDRTNLGFTLSPIIGHPHWKPKYNGAIHEIVRGINPLEHKNDKHEHILELIKKIQSSKKKIKKEIAEIKGKAKWVEDFLLDYCLNNELPHGQRHSVICKNLAILICFRSDKDSIIEKFIKTQKMSDTDLRGWINSATRGDITKTSPAELRKYISDNSLPYKIREMQYQYDVNTATTEALADMNNPYLNIQLLIKKIPFFYDKNCLYWFWNSDLKKWEYKDETDIMNIIGKAFRNSHCLIESKLVTEYKRAIEHIGRENIPKEPPKEWIQFKDKVYDIKTKKEFEATPEYFFTNPIPWSIGKTSHTPTIDKLFRDWVSESWVQDLYEVIAYCCYRAYPIQTLIALYGGGRNGKSQFQKINIRFLGKENTCSTELDALSNPNSRFESFKLYKKLMCSMGETNFGTLQNTSMLKKLTGGDIIGYEVKNKTPFDDYNYAKIIIGSNSLPSSDDTSDGYVRRWHIIDFPNEFPEGKDIMETIPDEEYENLAKKVCEILPLLIDVGYFKNQSSIVARRERYVLASNPLPLFIKNFCIIESDKFVLYSKLYTEYVRFLLKHKKRKVKNKEFRSALENEGYYIDKASPKINGEFKNGYYVMGLDLNYQVLDNLDNLDKNYNLFSYKKEVEKTVKIVKIVKKDDKSEGIVVSNESIMRDVVIKKCQENPNGWYFESPMETIVCKMMSDGTIFEVKPGMVKLV